MIGPHQVNGVGPKVLFARQSNGDLVKMRCPTCSRSDFSNMQGFINHCNLRHKMPLNSHIEAANMCGVRVVWKEKV